MKKREKTIFEKTVELLDKNKIVFEIEGRTKLQFVDTEETESWKAETALAMVVQQKAWNIDNGVQKATAGQNKRVINDILSGRITLVI